MMRIKQISIFMENRSGRLSSVLREVAKSGVSIRALSLADTSDFGILRLIVDKPDLCEKALKETGYTVSTTSVLAVEVPDRPGGLAGVLDVLSAADVNVEYMYAFVSRVTENALVVFRFEEVDQALEVLERAGISVVEASTVYSL